MLFRLLKRPGVLLVFLCLLALVNYYDRGAFVGILPILQAAFGMDDASAGLIGGAFISMSLPPVFPYAPAALTSRPHPAPVSDPVADAVGYSLVSPVMAQASRYVPSGPLLMVGMVAWVIATGLCTFASGFWYLAVRSHYPRPSAPPPRAASTPCHSRPPLLRCARYPPPQPPLTHPPQPPTPTPIPNPTPHSPTQPPFAPCRSLPR